MIKIRFHGRGGQGVKTASRILGEAAIYEGFVAQDSPIYGAERRGAPVVAFTRISDHTILERGYVFDPDFIVLMDDTLLNDLQAKPLEGLKPHGLIFINSFANQVLVENYLDFVSVIYDLTGLSLRYLEKPVISTAAAAAAAKIIGDIKEESVVNATLHELEELNIPVEQVEANIRLVKEVYREVPNLRIKTTPLEQKMEVTPLQTIHSIDNFYEITALGNSYQRGTGNWRVFRPVIDYTLCTGCMVCFVYCPEAVIRIRPNGMPDIDYMNCKGCLICSSECPRKAISVVREVGHS